MNMTLQDFLMRLFLLGARRFLRCGICLPGCGMDTIFPGAEAQVPVPDMRIPVLYGEGEFPCGVPALRCGQ